MFPATVIQFFKGFQSVSVRHFIWYRLQQNIQTIPLNALASVRSSLANPCPILFGWAKHDIILPTIIGCI